MAPLIARETPEGDVGRVTYSACKVEDLARATEQRLGLFGLRQRDHGTVAEVDVDPLALPREPAAEQKRPRDRAGAEQQAGEDVISPHRPSSSAVPTCASPANASWAPASPPRARARCS